MITVMTPTYNRAYILDNAYQSLLKQTDKDFLWLIVDDGSTDDTETLVQKWMDEKKIRIEYLKKPNGGKASALNLAIESLNTEYAVCLDSDDMFYPDTIRLAAEKLDTIRDDEAFCGIVALRHNPDGTVMGGRDMPRDAKTVTAADLFVKWCLNTELICFYKTAVLQQYRFPTFEGEKFVSPAWMQYKVTEKYCYLPVWEKLCECEYVSDGLTKNKRRVIVKNPNGYSCVKRYSFNLAPTMKLRVKHGIMYDCGCILAKNRQWLEGVDHKILACLLKPAAYIVCRRRFK